MRFKLSPPPLSFLAKLNCEKYYDPFQKEPQSKKRHFIKIEHTNHNIIQLCKEAIVKACM